MFWQNGEFGDLHFLVIKLYTPDFNTQRNSRRHSKASPWRRWKWVELPSHGENDHYPMDQYGSYVIFWQCEWCEYCEFKYKVPMAGVSHVWTGNGMRFQLWQHLWHCLTITGWRNDHRSKQKHVAIRNMLRSPTLPFFSSKDENTDNVLQCAKNLEMSILKNL